MTHDARTIRYPDPLIKVNDTVRIDLDTSKITDFIKFDSGMLPDYKTTICSMYDGFFLNCFLPAFFQVTCAWWPVALTWGVLVWSPTGSVTLAPSMLSTSKTAQATASPPGSRTSLSLARWGHAVLVDFQHFTRNPRRPFEVSQISIHKLVCVWDWLLGLLEQGWLWSFDKQWKYSIPLRSSELLNETFCKVLFGKLQRKTMFKF